MGVLGTDEDPLKANREKMRKMLAKGEKITINQDGQINTADNSGSNIQIPPGKLATQIILSSTKSTFWKEWLSRYDYTVNCPLI